MKKILLRTLAAVLVLLIAVIGYLFLSLNSLVKKAVETVGPKVTGVDVRLGSALISPWSGSGKLTGLLIGNPPGYTTSSAIRVGSISVAVDKATLLANPIVIDRIVIENPELILEGTLNGNNLGRILDNVKSITSSGSKEETSAKGKYRKFIVKEVVISGITLHAVASAMGQNVEQNLSLPTLHLQNIGSGGAGVSASELSEQILTPLLSSAIREGINILAKQGLKQLEKQGAGQLQNALKGLFK
jgi:hypothetical protein